MIPSVIRVDEYLAHALSLTEQEFRLRKRLMEWIPNSIIDCHVHSNLMEHVEFMEDETIQTSLSTFPSVSIDESAVFNEIFYPGKVVRKLRFPHVFRGMNHREANAYLLSSSPAYDRVAVFGLPEDVEYTLAIMHHSRASALKMYYSYVSPKATQIYQCFPPEILEVAQDLSLPIILHLPKVVTESVDDLMLLLNNFPKLTVVLAHLGLPKLPVPGLLDVYKKIVRFDNVFLDTAMNPSSEVIRMALEAFGLNRIIFGSDEPVNMLRYAVYLNPDLGQRVVTTYKYHWANAAEHEAYKHLAQDSVHVHWQSIMAIKKAIKMLPKNKRGIAKENIFHNNGMAVYSF
jgi:hypothetical protein